MHGYGPDLCAVDFAAGRGLKEDTVPDYGVGAILNRSLSGVLAVATGLLGGTPSVSVRCPSISTAAGYDFTCRQSMSRLIRKALAG